MTGTWWLTFSVACTQAERQGNPYELRLKMPTPTQRDEW